MNSLTKNEMYHDYPSSPSRRTTSYHTQSLNRQTSRGFDPYAQQQNGGLYSLDEASQAYDTPRYNERMHSGMTSYNTFDTGIPQAWNASGFGQNNNLAALGGTGRRGSARPPRGGLPNNWPDPSQQYGYGAHQVSFGSIPPMGRHDLGGDDEELIPTAIVIKNIPFAVKKEQLVDIMTTMGLPLPYAFNYHFDNGVFRGLAFANFTTAEETQAVIQHMNNLNLEGRKLRVEYKKMLPQAERDRIEREKRERRGQLEEQHRPLGGSQLQPSSSLSSIGGALARTPSPSMAMSPQGFDMNDPLTLEYYTKLSVFNSDRNGPDTMDFPPQLPPEHRKLIHGLAHNMGLSHQSEGVGDQRYIRIARSNNSSMALSSYEAMRRGLHRSATTDFSQSRQDPGYGPTRDAPSFLGMDPHANLSTSALRAAKSHADLRSYTPSPAQSAASFPANIANRYDYGYGQDSPGTSRPNITPTSMMPSNDDFLVNGIGSLNLGGGQYAQNQQGSPQRLRAMVSWDRQPAPGPIGGHRAFSANLEDSNRSRSAVAPARQPRGPAPGHGPGFLRGGGRSNHRARGSDERSSPNGTESIGE